MDKTSFDDIFNQFFKRIEKDGDFFSYYNVEIDEAIKLAKEQALGYILEAIELFTDRCNPDIDLFDYDVNHSCFNIVLTKKEQGLLADLMREVYFERDLSLLKAFKIAMTPNDLNQFSPASERKTFTDMLRKIKYDNEVKLSKYSSVDRITGNPKLINYGEYMS